MTALERQLFEFDYSEEKGEHPDQQNITLCTGSRYLNGSVPSGRWCDSKFGVYSFDASYCYPSLRSRRVWA